MFRLEIVPILKISHFEKCLNLKNLNLKVQNLENVPKIKTEKQKIIKRKET
jgi:hypothetical protein